MQLTCPYLVVDHLGRVIICEKGGGHDLYTLIIDREQKMTVDKPTYKDEQEQQMIV